MQLPNKLTQSTHFIHLWMNKITTMAVDKGYANLGFDTCGHRNTWIHFAHQLNASVTSYLAQRVLGHLLFLFCHRFLYSGTILLGSSVNEFRTLFTEMYEHLYILVFTKLCSSFYGLFLDTQSLSFLKTRFCTLLPSTVLSLNLLHTWV